MSFTIEIVSVPDRDHLVAEIWSGDSMVAELYREDDSGLMIEIYPQSGVGTLHFRLNDLRAAIDEAQRRLG